MPAPKSIQRFFLPSLVFSLALLLFAVGIAAFFTLRSHRIEDEFRLMEAEAALIVEALGCLPDEPVDSLPQFVRNMASDGTRISVFHDSFVPLVPSDRDLADSLRKIIGSAELRSGRSTFRLEHALHVARPLSTGVSTGYLLLSRSTGAVTRDIRNTGSALFAAFVLLTGAITVLSYRTFFLIVNPVRELVASASQYAGGALHVRTTIWEPAELTVLSDTMNTMAHQLDTRIRSIEDGRNELDAILAGMAEGLILVDSENRIRRLNRAAAMLFPESADPRGKLLLDLVRNIGLHEIVRETLGSGVQQERTIPLYRKETLFLQVHAGPVPMDDGTGVLLVLNDITRIQRLESIRRDFVANVSHELKTPITSIQGFVETLADGAVDDPDQARHFLKIIAKHTGRLNAIIEDLLQLSRIEQNREPLQIEPARIDEIVRAVRSVTDQKALEKRISVTEEAAGSPVVRVNAGLLERAIANLVDNAITYTPPEGAVHIRWDHSADSIRISIADTGPGIPLPDQERIFERFYRLDQARSRELGGTGLGLAIVKHVALIHGGHASVQSIVGRGSTFIIEIPQ